MAFFSDDEFTREVGDKAGNIRFFRSILRKSGLLSPREKLNDDHVKLFKKIQYFKLENRCTWEYAIREVLSHEKNNSVALNNITERTSEADADFFYREILKKLTSIDEKLGLLVEEKRRA